MITAAQLVNTTIYLVVFGLIFSLLWWFVSYVGLPEPFAKVARVVIAFAAVLLLISLLLSLAGITLIK